MGARATTLVLHGSSGLRIDIECRLSNNLPTIVIVGSASRAVTEARERLRGAFAASKLPLPRKRITLNLAPADIPKTDTGFDLAMAVAILLASDAVQTTLHEDYAYIGELALDGRVRPVRGIIGKILAGRAQGITTFFIPAENLVQAQLVPRVTLVSVSSLADLAQHLRGLSALPTQRTGQGVYTAARGSAQATPTLSEIRGHEQAKRCLLIATAGGHSTYLEGTPGAGKSLLARAALSLLPPLSHEAILEVTQLHSLSSADYASLVTQPPLREPHHSISRAALIGGGRFGVGELSLAHRGILLLDELPEFQSHSLEALRQPLTDHHITVTYSGVSTRLPAHCLCIATGNPCPCGFYGSARPCTCQPGALARYRRKLSGPLLDRIDLCLSVPSVSPKELLATKPDRQLDALLRAQVGVARQRQAKRFGGSPKLNADMTSADITRYAALDAGCTALMSAAAISLGLSTRAVLRTIAVARTIADLEEHDHIDQRHLSEALAYRQRVTPD